MGGGGFALTRRTGWGGGFGANEVCSFSQTLGKNEALALAKKLDPHATKPFKVTGSIYKWLILPPYGAFGYPLTPSLQTSMVPQQTLQKTISHWVAQQTNPLETKCVPSCVQTCLHLPCVHLSSFPKCVAIRYERSGHTQLY